MLNKYHTHKPLPKPRYARTPWRGVCVGVLLTWLSACKNNPASPPPSPTPPKEHTNPGPTPTPDPSPSQVALTEELIEALGAGVNLEDYTKKNLQTLQQALRAIRDEGRDIKQPIVAKNKAGHEFQLSVLQGVLLSQGAPPLLQALIDRGADVNQKVDGESLSLPLLATAALVYPFQTIRCLLEAEKIDVKAADQAVCGGLVRSILENKKLSPDEKKNLVNTLAQKGIDISARDKHGYTLLNELVYSLRPPGEDHKKGVENIEILLAAEGGKQALYYVDDANRTPWEIAAYAGHIEVAKQLIAAMTAEKADAKTIVPNNTWLLATDASQLKRANDYLANTSRSVTARAAIRQAFIAIGIAEDKLVAVPAERSGG